MNIYEIAPLVNGTIVTKTDGMNKQFKMAFASDLMSDVLTINGEGLLLITGLINIQAIRTAEMSDISCIIFARNKQVPVDIINLASENNITIIRSPYSIFRISGILFVSGIQPVY